MGNLFGIFPGKDMTLPPIAIGSHLDIQPAGGRFDGILGVMCGLEIIVRSSNDAPTLFSDDRRPIASPARSQGVRLPNQRSARLHQLDE